MPTEIPKPPGWPIIGNALELVEPNAVAKILARHGPIVKISYGTSKPDRIFVGTVELADEICDETRFAKSASVGGAVQLRHLAHDGLFTARGDEENWGLAHHILTPVLGPMMIGNMFEDMHEMACQLVMKWARLDQDAAINVSDDFTRLTLDTLALCTMDTRFNSFYRETPHAFVEAMNSCLSEAGMRMLRPAVITEYVYRTQTRKFYEDIELMRHIAERVVERRKNSSSRKNDLVNAMLYGKDPVTNKALPHDSVIDNMITFLIAGHETTSGLLSFVMYCLVTHPDAMTKAREEVVSLLGSGPMSRDMTSKLPYVMGVIRETLRLYPTAPGFTVQAKSTNPEDYPMYIGKEQYTVRQGETCSVQVATVHRDPAVYGSDAGSFRPERMVDEEFSKLPKNAWKPFGNGARGCIGRVFALQETVIVLALLLQNFDFELADPDYRLKIRKALTIKPLGLEIRAKLRDGLTPATLQRRLLGGKTTPPDGGPVASQKQDRADSPLAPNNLQDLLICYGSNTGTCQTLAHALRRDATSHGFNANCMPMDQVQPHHLLPSTPIVIITASYEGQPPDNAVRFVKWLQALTESPFEGMCHSVYGCGNRDWATTFQRIPILVDDAFARCGSTPLVKRGVSDAADCNVANEFDYWADNALWPALERQYHTEVPKSSGGINIIENPRASELLSDARAATVEEERVLTTSGEPPKRHLKIRLPPGMSYRAGDHLVILPANHEDAVEQVMNRFEMAHDAQMSLPTGKDFGVYTYLRDFVELNNIATEKNIRAIIASAPDSDAKKHTMIRRNSTALQILQALPSASLSFSDYLAMLPPIRPRRYSISSSPSADLSTCTLTYSVLEHTLTRPNGTSHAFHGAGSTYLAGLRPNDRLHVSVRPSPTAFHLPEDPTIPIVMVCAGSGIAPFLGFVHERARLGSSGVKLAPTLLFIGCRHPNRDMLYSSELEHLASSAKIKLFYAFSRADSQSKGCKYVQDRVWEERNLVASMIRDSGKMYICGGARVLEGVEMVMKKTFSEAESVDGAVADEWWKAFRADGDRFACEVFD